MFTIGDRIQTVIKHEDREGLVPKNSVGTICNITTKDDGVWYSVDFDGSIARIGYDLEWEDHELCLVAIDSKEDVDRKLNRQKDNNLNSVFG